MLDNDLARLYGVETKALNQAVKRDERRFPERFRFLLMEEEFDGLRSQSVTSNARGGRGQCSAHIVFLPDESLPLVSVYLVLTTVPDMEGDATLQSLIDNLRWRTQKAK